MINSISEIKHILNNQTVKIEEKTIVSLPTKNGILDPLHVEVQRGLCIVEGLNNNANSMVSVKQNYPKDGHSVTTFKADMVVLDGREYRLIIELLNSI